MQTAVVMHFISRSPGGGLLGGYTIGALDNLAVADTRIRPNRIEFLSKIVSQLMIASVLWSPNPTPLQIFLIARYASIVCSRNGFWRLPAASLEFTIIHTKNSRLNLQLCHSNAAVPL